MPPSPLTPPPPIRYRPQSENFGFFENESGSVDWWRPVTDTRTSSSTSDERSSDNVPQEDARIHCQAPVSSNGSPPASQSRLALLVQLLQTVGGELAASDKALERAWGRHLLEDWRSLELLAQRREQA